MPAFRGNVSAQFVHDKGEGLPGTANRASIERLLDQTAFFLHTPMAKLSERKRRMIEELYQTDKVLAGKKYSEILGVHAIGDASSEFIVAAAGMVETEMCISGASEIVFPHPTVSEALREAILGIH